jgi:hypothetical protein
MRDPKAVDSNSTLEHASLVAELIDRDRAFDVIQAVFPEVGDRETIDELASRLPWRAYQESKLADGTHRPLLCGHVGRGVSARCCFVLATMRIARAGVSRNRGRCSRSVRHALVATGVSISNCAFMFR